MAQGEFTKHEAAETVEAVREIFQALPKDRWNEFRGHLKDILSFLRAAAREAPPDSGTCHVEDDDFLLPID